MAGAGTTTPINAYVTTFERNVRFLAQQKGSKLRQFVQTRGETSKSHNWDRVGQLSAVPKAGRGVATPVSGTPWSRRADSQATKHAGDLVEPEDPVQMFSDPLSAITHALGMALGRAMDDIIIAAATGNAQDGNGNTIAFNGGGTVITGNGGLAAQFNGGTQAGNQIVGDGTSAITLDLIALVNQAFMQNDIEPEQPKVFVVGPVQVRQIAELDKATSTFFVNAKALAASGMVRDWMGYTWIFSNRLTVPAVGQLSCLAFSEMALGLHTTKDVWTQLAQDPSVSYAWRPYGAFTAGAVRIEDEHIVALNVLNQ